MTITKRLRFEILRRDNHACRYCGATAPDVKLTVDHVLPTALGGTDAAENLVAACAGCNAGKSSSSPDPTIVADVDAKALLWLRAVRVAFERERTRRSDLETEVYWVIEYWNGLGDAFACGPAWAPPDWGQRIEALLLRGLAKHQLAKFMWETFERRAAGAIHGEAWHYFAAIARNTIERIEADARTLIDSGAVS